MTVTGLQLALCGGVLLGAGVALLVWRLLPARPDLGDVLSRLSPDQGGPARRGPDVGDGSAADRLGGWGVRALPGSIWGRPLDQELALLRIPVTRYYGEKLLFALLGTVAAPLLSLLLTVLGWRLPVLLPVGGTVVLAVGLFFLPDYNVRDDAKRARTEFARALGAYTDLVALERNSGSGPRQALEVAAAVGDNWVFRRLREELAYSSWSGEQPWDALRRLSHELGVTELADLGDIMRLSGEEGAQIYGQLRPLGRHAYGHAQRRGRPLQRGGGEDVDPHEPAGSDLPRHPRDPRPTESDGAVAMDDDELYPTRRTTMRTLAQCHHLALRFEDYLAEQWRIVAGTVKGDPERGSVTIEQVIWAVAIIGIVAIVVTAITNYVTSQAGKIK